MSASLTKREFTNGLAELDRLAALDYAESIWGVAGADTTEPDVQILRIGRLLGVSMKEPFSQSRKRPRPTKDTRSTRAWTLQPNEILSNKGARDTWQYKTLQAMAKEAKLTPLAMANTLRRERNFFGFLVGSTHKYICGDPTIRSKIQKNVKAARKAGIDLRLQDPEVIVSVGGLALGSYLISIAPILGSVGAPVIAGLVLLLYTIGVDAFCSWAASKSRSEE